MALSDAIALYSERAKLERAKAESSRDRRRREMPEAARIFADYHRVFGNVHIKLSEGGHTVEWGERVPDAEPPGVLVVVSTFKREFEAGRVRVWDQYVPKKRVMG